MRSSEYEPQIDDSICGGCNGKLLENFEPNSWQDHGFCNLMCAALSKFSLTLGGQPAIEMARLQGKYGGPGFESELVRDWLKAAKPNAPALLFRHTYDREGWEWRLMAGGRCQAQRLTVKE